MQAHPLTDKVPDTSQSDYITLREGIRSKGQIHPIITKDGLIWDGRNRQAICQQLGIEAHYEEYTGLLTAAEYILQANLRRNLTLEQRDTMIVALAKEVVPQMREEAKAAKKNGGLRGAATSKKASHANVREASDRSGETQLRFRKLVGQARKADDAIAVIKHDDLAAKVEKGELSLRAAAQEAVTRNKANRTNQKAKSTIATHTEVSQLNGNVKTGRQLKPEDHVPQTLTMGGVTPDMVGKGFRAYNTDVAGPYHLSPGVCQLEANERRPVMITGSSRPSDCKAYAKWECYCEKKVREQVLKLLYKAMSPLEVPKSHKAEAFSYVYSDCAEDLKELVTMLCADLSRAVEEAELKERFGHL